MIAEHFARTKSEVAQGILADWDASIKKFVQVFPLDYKKALANPPKEDGVASLSADQKEAVGINPTPEAKPKEIDLEDMKMDRCVLCASLSLSLSLSELCVCVRV